MIERTVFEQNLNSIRQKYQLISMSSTTKQINEFKQGLVTPVRPNKHTSKHSASNTNHTKQLNQHHKTAYETARSSIGKTSDIDQFICNKQNILKQRMELNQRILMKSKQLRDKQSRNNSQHQPNPSKQQPPNTYSLTQLKTLTDRYTTAVSANLKMQMDEANQKARRVFAQKIYKVIDDSLHSKQILVLQERKQNTRQLKPAVNGAYCKNNQEHSKEQKVLNAELEKLKIVNVFENTSKVQERIKAVLSSH